MRKGRTNASQKVLEHVSKLGFMTIGDLVSNETLDFPTVVNPSLPHLDYLLLNEFELGRLTATSLVSAPGCAYSRLESCAREVLGRGVRVGVVAHFPKGAICVTREGPMLFQPSVRLPNQMICGTAGAGDAFSAGFVLGLHDGWELQHCLELGVRSSPLSLRDVTCSASIENCGKMPANGKAIRFDDSLATVLGENIYG